MAADISRDRADEKAHFDLVVPFGVYTIPEISMVGATEDELRARGVAYEVGRAAYHDNARADHRRARRRDEAAVRARQQATSEIYKYAAYDGLGRLVWRTDGSANAAITKPA